MRFLLLANDGDATAPRVAAALRTRHPADSVALVTMRDLAQADEFTQTVNRLHSHTTIRLRTGVTIDSGDLGVVLNRLRHVAVPQFTQSNQADRDYATMEMYALLISWLMSLRCPVVNRGGSSGLSAVPRSALEWFQFAAAAGLRTPRLSVTSSLRRFAVSDMVPLGNDVAACGGSSPAFSSIVGPRRGWFLEPVGPRRRSLYVVGPHVSGDLSPETKLAASRLAATAGVSLARVDFCEALDALRSWMFVGIDEWPDLVDRESIDAAAALLENLAARETEETR
jgi:hypothetical protein